MENTVLYIEIFSIVLLSIYLYVSLSVCTSVNLSICLSAVPVYLSASISLCLSVCMSVFLSVFQSVCLSVSVCFLYLYLLSIWPDDRIGAGEGLQVDVLQGVQVVQCLHKYNLRRNGGISQSEAKYTILKIFVGVFFPLMYTNGDQAFVLYNVHCTITYNGLGKVMKCTVGSHVQN